MERPTNQTTVPAHTAATWLQRWDAQQEFYIADREERFAVIADVVTHVVASVDHPVVVDLGCGPGSLAARLHERLPRATIIGVDADPLLLGLARTHYGDTIEWVDGDLAGSTWHHHLPPTIHAAVSTTALHWLSRHHVAELYRFLGTTLAPGGALVNGDHLGHDDQRMNTLGTHVRDQRAQRAGVRENEQWDTWWDAALADPELAELNRVRATRLATRAAADGTTTGDETADGHTHHGNGLSVEGHTRLLHAAGFGSVAPVWQVGDDHVLVAIR
ncbi:class I SAM-dependent methyltransferase [Phytoactinopolyspora limicola]|uniref:class I SAM-dependent methyltransferase n=1 Tax=Phytoactinopolyspora limicola TaxID=2715536 RepID=UPI00140C75DD|nr:methyltransferase domain-containing protein [Phytoactinopolyspora limicola]